ncbi:MAG: TlpA disulfide reductase family protein [Thermoanaerobaculia bacterium]
MTHAATSHGRPSSRYQKAGWLAVAALLLARCASPIGGDGSELPPAPDFDLPSIAGERFRLADFADRVIVVDFWATWCTPCRLQAEILRGLHDQFGGGAVQFLAISLGEPEEVVREFARRHPFPYPVLVDTQEALGEALRIYALPTVMVVDRQGRVAYLRQGISDRETLRQALVEAGAESPTSVAG